MPVLNVPGLVVLKRRGNKAAQKIYEKVMTGSILDAWPVLAMCVLMIYAVGVIVWFLVSGMGSSLVCQDREVV